MPSSVLSDYIYCVFGWPLLKYASVAITCIAYNQYNDDKKKKSLWVYLLYIYQMKCRMNVFLGYIYYPIFSLISWVYIYSPFFSQAWFFLSYCDFRIFSCLFWWENTCFFLLLVCLHVVIDENRIWSLWPNNWFCWLIYWMATVLHIKAVADV